MKRFTKAILPMFMTTALAAGAPPEEVKETPQKEVTVFVQNSWPAQTETNKAIKELSPQLDTWDDIYNATLGVDVLWPVGDKWKVGFRADYSSGGLEQTVTEDGPFGFPVTIDFKQHYDLAADVLAVGKREFDVGKVKLFALGAAGLLYSTDKTTVRIPELGGEATIENSNLMPEFMLEGGVRVPIGKKLRFEGALGGVYGKQSKMQPVEGALAPLFADPANPVIDAENDITGPYVRFGIGWDF